MNPFQSIRPYVWLFGNAEQTIAPLLSPLLSMTREEVFQMPETPLCALMNRCGSNKGDRTHHPYTLFYERLFAGMDPRRIFEVGIGSKDPAMPYHMQPENTPGGSLRAWRDYFPNAEITGADYDQRILFQEDRIRTFFVDQRDPASIRRMIAAAGLENGSLDIIVDDAVHEEGANTLFYRETIHLLRDGGWFIIEDHMREPTEFNRRLAFSEALGYPAIIVDFTLPGRWANACFTAIRKA